MKKITFSVVLITMVSLALFAEGNQEETPWEPGPWYMERGYTNPEFEIKKLTLTGKIDLSDINVPKLTVGENTYELMVPYRLDYDIDIKEGDEITINGFEVPAYRRASNSETVNIMVTGVLFNGTEYDLNMMDNHGPAFGQKGRSGRFNNGGAHRNSRGCCSQPNNMIHRPFGRR